MIVLHQCVGTLTRQTLDLHVRRVRRDQDCKAWGDKAPQQQSPALAGQQEAEQVAEFARLAACLERVSMEEEEDDGRLQMFQVDSHINQSRRERIAELASRLEGSRESLTTGYDWPVYSGKDVVPNKQPNFASPLSETSDTAACRRERMYKMGVMKQRARNYDVESALERSIGIDLSRRFGLSFRPAGARQDPSSGQMRSSSSTWSICDDGRKLTSDDSLDDGPVRRRERERAREQEIAWQSSRRCMLQERVPPSSLPLPKAACALGGPDPQEGLADKRGGAARDATRELGKEALGRKAWGKGVTVNQGGMWRRGGDEDPGPRIRNAGSMHHGSDWHVHQVGA